MLLSEYRDRRKEVKLLLLGAGGAGKSTVIKQMQLMFAHGFEEEDRKKYTTLIFRNILSSMQAMLNAMGTFCIPFADPSLQDGANGILNLDPDTYHDIQPHSDLFIRLWNDAGIRTAQERGNEYHLSDSTPYFCRDMERIAAPGYIPSVADVLHAHAATTGIHELVFVVSGTTVFRMLDVGGQQSERRKWIHCFENVTAIIFIASCSEYDRMLGEQGNTNCMRESISMFEQILKSPWFKETYFFLFLNKLDILEEKVKRSPLRSHFPAFKGRDGSADDAKEFIFKMYLDVTPDMRDMYTHFTRATDSCFALVFSSVQSTILRNQLMLYDFE
jgi:GTPase SAR1 family protein